VLKHIVCIFIGHGSFFTNSRWLQFRSALLLLIKQLNLTYGSESSSPISTDITVGQNTDTKPEGETVSGTQQRKVAFEQ
jgi:hypothetical protein